MKTRLTKQQMNDIIALFNKGYSGEEISKQLGIKNYTIYYFLKHKGCILDTKQGRQISYPHRDKELKKMFDEGKTVREMSEITGYAEGTIRLYLSRLGLECRERKKRKAQEGIPELAAQGYTNAQIAEKLGLSESGFYYVVNAYNIDVKGSKNDR